MESRIKTSLWIEAHIRICFAADMPAFVVARGDSDRGGVLLKVDQFDAGITLYEKTMDFDGNAVWRCLYSGANTAEISEKIAKKRDFDPDLWVLEIEDMRQTYQPDAAILDG
ncbi:DUF1491 family protein [Kordiimonas aquimaris]|uniref:DUF1491 family protein n=1 Tax=Kordiimonas aquimaris TaxID=707591 RepID=UPI0021CDEC56|nr:DUF1491 family protein [Kordiimonas aquimaris]